MSPTDEFVPNPKPRCLIIVPAYNERTAVGKLIHRIHKHLPDFDVLLIDDGSTDDTARQASEHTKVVSLPFNLGIGGAMQTGYRYADFHGYDIAIQVDGDGQHRPSEVARLVEKLTNTDCDLVIGSRFMSDIKYRQSFTRMTGIHVLSTLIKWLHGPATTDCTSGFRAANRRVIRAFAHWYPDDYPEPEVVLLLHKAGYTVGEVPVRMRQRRSGMTSIPLMRGLFYVIKVTVCLLLDTIREPWPQERLETMLLLLRSLLLIAFGGGLLLLTVKRLKQYKLKERYALIFLFTGLPFLGLALWPDAMGTLAQWVHIEYRTLSLLFVSAFLLLMVLELLSIVSQQDRKITTLAQMVGILMEKQEFANQTKEKKE